MKKNQKILIIFTLSLVIFSLMLTSVYAAEEKMEDKSIIKRLTTAGVAAGYEDVSPYSFPRAIGRIIKVALSLLGIVFMSYIVHAGYLWMTARGDEEKLKKAKAIIRGSIIGLIIVISAYIITATVVDRFTIAGGQNIIEE